LDDERRTGTPHQQRSGGGARLAQRPWVPGSCKHPASPRHPSLPSATTKRFGFVVAQSLGHVTHLLNLQRRVANRDDVAARWLKIDPEPRTAWERAAGPALRSAARARAAIRASERSEPFDALLMHTDSIALLALDIMNRTPTVLSLDATPRSFDELAAHYEHRVHPDCVERVKAHWNRRVYHSAAAVISFSEWAKRSLTQDYGVPAEKIHVVPVGVDTDLWTPVRHERTDDGNIRFLFIGGDFIRKGGDLLLQWKRRTSKRCELHLVTRDDVPPEPGVYVHRFESNSKGLVDLVRTCDVFVLPTRADCSSHVSAEAMSSGLPVIATNVGGVPELIVDGQTGFVIAPDDYSALDDRMSRLATFAALRRKMGEEGRKRALTHYNFATNCDRVLDVLTSASRGAH
jgi:glycosyltransferase involved in cell wall biosynthesis